MFALKNDSNERRKNLWKMKRFGVGVGDSCRLKASCQQIVGGVTSSCGKTSFIGEMVAIMLSPLIISYHVMVTMVLLSKACDSRYMMEKVQHK